MVRDRLYKDITYRQAAGDDAKEPPTLTLGARFRDSGFKNGLIDDLQVFDTALTAAEVAEPSRQRSCRRDARSSTSSPGTTRRIRRPSPNSARSASPENALIADVPEIMVMEEMPTPRPTHLLEPRRLRRAAASVVPRDTPASLPPFPADQPRNRLGLARWLTEPPAIR